jgi:hypothetical protein
MRKAVGRLKVVNKQDWGFMKLVIILLSALLVSGCKTDGLTAADPGKVAPPSTTTTEASLAPLFDKLGGKFALTDCGYAENGYCYEYGAYSISIAAGNYESNYEDFYRSDDLSTVFDKKTRVTVAAAPTLVSDLQVNLVLSGTETTYETPASAATVVQMNTDHECGKTNWVLNVEQVCSTMSDNGQFIVLTGSGNALNVSVKTNTPSTSVANDFQVKYFQSTPSQADANGLFADMVGSFSMPYGVPSTACPFSGGETFIVTQASLEVRMETYVYQGDKRDLVTNQLIPFCVHEVSKFIYPIISVKPYDNSVVELNLNSFVHLEIPQDADSAAFYASNFTCGTAAWSAGTPITCIEIGNTPTSVLIKLKNSILSHSRWTPNFIPLYSDSSADLDSLSKAN